MSQLLPGRIILAVLLGLFCLTSTPCPTLAAEPLIELKQGEKTLTGRRFHHNADQVWLQSRDGQIHELELKQLTGHRRLGGSFSPLSQGDARDQLRAELGREFEIIGTGQYLIAGPPGAVQNYAQTFEDMYRSFRNYFTIRGLPDRDPEFPLLAIVFPDQASFQRYAKQQGTPVVPGMKGFYSALSNRTLLFHERPLAAAQQVRELERIFPQLQPETSRLNISPAIRTEWQTIDSSLQATIIHETTHQMAFNLGLHRRMAHNPQWVVEGLACTFEAPGIREPRLAQKGAKWNSERLEWFRKYQAKNRPADALEQMIRSDSLFQSSPLDAYSQAWAWSFFLLETRPTEYVRYLQLTARREPLTEDLPSQRVAEFQSVFGGEWALLEAQFQRFLAEQR